MPSSAAVRRALLGGAAVLGLYGIVAYTTAMPGASHAGPLPDADSAVEDLALELEGHVSTLAGSIGERNTSAPHNLERARDYIAAQLRGAAVALAPVELEPLGPAGLDADSVLFELRGRSSEIVLVGAHYDSAPGTPGANDNASGVAVAIELAQR